MAAVRLGQAKIKVLRQRLEQTLHEREETFRSAFDHTNVAMVLTGTRHFRH
jgi:hypothetical protein